MRDLIDQNEESRQGNSHKVHRIGWSQRKISGWFSTIARLFEFREKALM